MVVGSGVSDDEKVDVFISEVVVEKISSGG
jgi:hypothetical protein